jgi:hypothetical protein
MRSQFHSSFGFYTEEEISFLKDADPSRHHEKKNLKNAVRQRMYRENRKNARRGR